MKTLLWLNPELAKTHRVPHPDPFGTLWNEWMEVCLDVQFAEDKECLVAARAVMAEYIKTHGWQEVPLFMKGTVLLGRGAAMRGYGKKPGETSPTDNNKTLLSPSMPILPMVHYETHPDNYEAMDEENKAKWDARPHPGEYKFIE